MLIVLISIQSIYVNKFIWKPYIITFDLIVVSDCDHTAAQIRSHTIADHNMLYTTYSWICQSCIAQSTFNSMEKCLLTLIILADYLIYSYCTL